MAGAGLAFGCGQCLPCRINKRRQWMWRQFFESLIHEENAFVTLTYADEHLPRECNLDPRALQLFLKRLRKSVWPAKIRFFAVGEYGQDGKREFNPHYHLSLFGVSGFSDWIGSRQVRYGVAEAVHQCWPYGNIDCKEFNESTASYVAGYTVKKLTSVGDPKLKGRTPEFMRSSRRPGLGADAMPVIAQQLLASGHFNGDVPRQLKLGKKNIPLGRYLLKKAREACGMTPEQIEKVKSAISMETSLEMLALFKDDLATEEDAAWSPAKSHAKRVAQRVLNAEARYKIFEAKKGKL